MANPVMDALARAKVRETEQRETAAASVVQGRLQLPPRMANRDEFPVFEAFCHEKGLRYLPARPATVAFFLLDNVALGISRLLAVVESISAVHAGLADPTLSPCVSAALATISPIAPPRSWPVAEKHQFIQLPRSLQTYVAEREISRDRAVRDAQNGAATARKKKEKHGSTSPVTEPAAEVAS